MFPAHAGRNHQLERAMEQELCSRHWRAGQRSVLLRLDIAAYRHMLIRGGAPQEQVEAASSLAILVSMHKARCILQGIPASAKLESEQFLQAYGYAVDLKRRSTLARAERCG